MSIGIGFGYTDFIATTGGNYENSACVVFDDFRKFDAGPTQKYG
jgi:hypothetical protein